MHVKFFPAISEKRPIFTSHSLKNRFSFIVAGLLTIGGLLLISARAHATSTAGGASDIFNIGAGARSMAMGGAYTALSDDASAPYFNPAGLAYLDEHQVMFMHAPLYMDSSYNYIASANPFGDKMGALALSDAMMLSNKIELRDKFNNLTDSNGSLQNSAIMASYARKVFKQKLSLGLNGKFIQQKLVGFSGSGAGVDIGAMYKPVSFLNVGASLLNLNSPSVKLRSTSDVYRPIARLGLASEIMQGRLVLSADMIKTEGENRSFAAGLEYSPMRLFSIRAGFNDNRAYTFGLGMHLKKLYVDYALSNTDLGAFNKVSITYAWHNIYKTELEPPMKEGRAVYPLSGFENQVAFKTNVPSQMVARWTLDITDNEGKPVRTLEADLRPPEMIAWDAKNSIGEPVVDGTYNYRFLVTYKNGKTWENNGSLQLELPDHAMKEVIDMSLQLNGTKESEQQNAQSTTKTDAQEPAK